jgi:hypothetical protein
MMGVTRKWWNVLQTAGTGRIKRFEGLSRTPLSTDRHGAIRALDGRGVIFLAIRHGQVGRAFTLLEIDGLNVKVSASSRIKIWWRERLRRAVW